MTQQTTSFLGIPIAGDITRGEQRANQRPQTEFAPLMQALLDDPTIVAFGWAQYTPYFNDGDPCIFHACCAWVHTDADEVQEPTEDEDENENSDRFEIGNYHPTLGKIEWIWEEAAAGRRERKEMGYTGPDRARYDRCKAFGDAIDSGAFDDVLLELFGDHAEITVRRTGISVEFYSHD